MLVVATISNTVVCGARGVRCLAPHPLPDCLGLLSGVVNLASELPDLLLKLSPLVGDVIQLSLYEEPLVTHHDLLVHKQAPARRIQSEIEVVIVAVTEPLLDSQIMVLVDGDLQFLHLAHLPLQPVHLIETHTMPGCQGEGSRPREGQLELSRGL
jgi:hypothetical protein